MAINLTRTPTEVQPLTETTTRTLYHGGNSPVGIDPTRLATRQAADGHAYAGYYMSENPNFSANYARENGGNLYQIKFPEDLKIKLYDGNITRVEQSFLKQMMDEGYDIMQGRNPSKQMEYILLNPNRISEANIVDESLLSKLSKGASRIGRIAGKGLGAIGSIGMLYDIYKGLKAMEDGTYIDPMDVYTGRFL